MNSARGKKKISLVGFKTLKFICVSCHKSYATLPLMQGLDKGDECECGNTSFITKSGRVLGKKSRQWKYWFDLYASIKNIMPKEFLGAVYR